MHHRFLIFSLLLATLAGCDQAPRTFTETLHLKKEVNSVDLWPGAAPVGRSSVDYSVKFDKTPAEGHKSLGTAYYRIEISNLSDHQLVIKKADLQFEDELKIAVEKCYIIRPDLGSRQQNAIWLESGEVFSRSGSCTLPISQMDGVMKVPASLENSFWRKAHRTSGPFDSGAN